LNKRELFKKVSIESGFQLQDTTLILNAFFNIIFESLEEELKINFSNFGNFKVKEIKSSNRYNVNKKLLTMANRYYKPIFKFSKRVKQKVKNGRTV
jgi:nucleoid DNA-binding protein